MTVHLLVETLTLLVFLVCLIHAAWRHGRTGAGFLGALLLVGFVREGYVALRDVLYGFAPLHLMLGPAPLIASVIWGLSIYAAVVWATEVTGQGELGAPAPGPRFYAAAALFMMALAGFYEPFLELVGMARWEPGTRATFGVPWIALVGYPSLSVAFLLTYHHLRAPRGRRLIYPLTLVLLAVSHAWGLDALKYHLGW